MHGAISSRTSPQPYTIPGTESSICERDGTTALHVAARIGSIEVATFLIEEAGADPSPIDQWRNTPLDVACDGAHQATPHPDSHPHP